MQHIPRPGTEPVSPALVGRFLTTGPQGKSLMGEVKLRDVTRVPRDHIVSWGARCLPHSLTKMYLVPPTAGPLHRLLFLPEQPFIPPLCEILLFLQDLCSASPVPRLEQTYFSEVLTSLVSLHSADQSRKCKNVRKYFLLT